MAKERPEPEHRVTNADHSLDEPFEPLEPSAGQNVDIAPDVAVEPEAPAEDEEDVRRMWEASDPIEGEAPTG